MHGRELLKSLLDSLPNKPGIYQMYNEFEQIIYIGKAKNIKNRVANYLSLDLSTKTITLVAQIYNLDFVITDSEVNALLLEAQLVKKHQPKFNILLKDDKSFPYIKLRTDHPYPQLVKYRGKIDCNSKLFGPFAANYLIKSTLDEIYKIFRLRSCTDHYFSSRKRPCIQYEIKRCSAPCTNKISHSDYLELVSQTEQFLLGNTKELQANLATKMHKLSNDLKYEEAATIRDRIKSLSYVQLQHRNILASSIDTDVIVVVNNGKKYCIGVLIYRKTQYFGSRTYFPEHTEDCTSEEVLEAFLGQFYQNKTPPQEILVNYNLSNINVLIEAFKKQTNKKITINMPKSGNKLKLLQNAIENALATLSQHLQTSIKNIDILTELRNLFKLVTIPERIEVYDNSHIMGSFAVGAMIVATPNGFNKNEYRIFNVEINSIENNLPIGDDYTMLKKLLQKRFSKLSIKKNNLPDLLIIDGGKGHLNIVKNIMAESKLNIPFVCMSKGIDRNAGREQFHLASGEIFTLDKNTKLMKYLQILRDEAHNYAINQHRKKRSKAIKISQLDNIESIGPVRKKALLDYFGDINAIKEATIEDLAKVPNVSKKIANIIFKSLRNN